MTDLENALPIEIGSSRGRSEAAGSTREEEFRGLYRAHRDRLLAHAFGITRDFHGACDVVQETFLKASREPRLWSEGFGVRAWLLRVCGNLALNRVREESRRRVRETGRRSDFPHPKEEPALPGRPAAPDPGPTSPDPAEEALRRQMGRELLAAMETLPAAYRRVLLLRYSEELSCAEIAELLGVPRGTVMSWVHRARLVLRRRLDP